MNAIEQLTIITKSRNWHQGKLGPAKKAAQLKTNLGRGKVSYKKCCNILNQLGYVQTRTEQWISGDLLI